MALLSQEEIKNIRMHANIVDVISSYIPLTHKGKNYFGVCPFHEDHSPSMSVSEDKQIYKCFSCGAAGNVFTFVQNYENISFIEAVDLIAKRYGLTLSTHLELGKPDKNGKYYEIMDIALKFFQNNLKTEFGHQARDYLLSRGLDNDAIKEFGVGLALASDQTLYKLLTGKKYTLQDIENVALINVIDDKIYDNFINRVMFPLQDPKGNIIGFSGRVYYESSAPKYLNTRETIIFKKRQMLFNYHRARPYIRNEKAVILVEGYMDAIRLYINGVKNVLAIMGTSLAKEQISLLKKLNAKVILCLDNDDAGQKAIYEIGQTLKKDGFNVEVIKLSGQKDPDEYVIKNGIEAFIKNLKEPLKFFDFSLNYLKQNKNLNETVDLANYINEVLMDLTKENDDILIDLTLKRLAGDYNLEYDMLKNKLASLKVNVKNIEEITTVVEEPKKTLKNKKYMIACQKILFYMMNEAKYVRIYQNNLVFLDDLNYREIAKALIYYYESNKDINLADFLSYASTNERFYPEVLDILNKCSEESLEEEEFFDYLKTINIGNKQKTIKELKQSLKEELDKNKKIEIAMQIAELKRGSV